MKEYPAILCWCSSQKLGQEINGPRSKMCDGVEVISVEMFDIITVIERVPPKDSQCHDNLSLQVCDKIQFDNLVMIVC